MNLELRPRLLTASIPYVAIAVGLHWFSSAWIAMVLYHIGALAFVFVTVDKSHWHALISGWDARIGVLLSVACGISGVSILFAWPHVGLTDPSLADRLAAIGVRAETWLPFFVYIVMVTPWLEELFWRGRLGNEASGLTGSDILFGGYHILVLVKFVRLPAVLLAFASLVCAAWVWRQVFKKRRGLLVPVLSHFVADVATIAAVYALAR